MGLANVAKLFSASFFSASGFPLEDEQAPPTSHNVLVGGGLSSRERRILQLLGEGLSTRDVASVEFLAVNTVRSYVQSALWKLGAHSRLQAVALAREAGLI
jgi:DNA-binding NarL/FixJ family response regulator